MNFQKFIDFVGNNIDFLSKDDIKLIINGNHVSLFTSLDKKYKKEKNSKRKARYESIILFLGEFVKDFKQNSYKYNYSECNKPEHFVYWYNFYIKNNLLSSASTTIKDYEAKFPDKKPHINKLKSRLDKYQHKYKKEYDKVKDLVDKNNQLKHIEMLVGQGEYGRAMYEALKYLEKYPNDTKIKQYMKRIDQMKSEQYIEKIDTGKEFFEKVGLIELIKKVELDKRDISDIFKKLTYLKRTKDFDLGLSLIKFVKDKYQFEDPRLLKYYNSFIEIKTKKQQHRQDVEYSLELKSLQLLMKNKQYQDSLIKANSILKKYPLIDKKRIFKIITRINKEKASLLRVKKKGKADVWLENVLMTISPLTMKSLFVFFEKMAWFLKAKMDLKISLQVIFFQSKDLSVKKFVRDIMEGVDSGMKISEILGWYRQVGRLDVSLVKMGEMTGKLGEVFQTIYAQKKEEQRRIKQIKSVMLYPSVVISIVILIFIGLLIFIIPKFTEFYSTMDVELPLITQVVVAISEFLRFKWYYAIGIVIVIIFVLKMLNRFIFGQYIYSFLGLKIPVLKSIIFRKYIIYFAGNIAILLKAGINLLQAFDLLTYGCENLLYSDEFKRIRFELETGISFSKAVGLGDITKIGQYQNHYIPIELAYSIDIGEKTGQLGSLLGEIAERYDEELKLIIKNLQSLMEPFIIVFVGVFVFIFVLSVFLPLMGLYNVIGKMGGL